MRIMWKYAKPTISLLGFRLFLLGRKTMRKDKDKDKDIRGGCPCSFRYPLLFRPLESIQRKFLLDWLKGLFIGIYPMKSS